MTQLIVREYLRVSKDAKGTGKSPDQQHDENLRAFEQLGWLPHPSPPYRDTDRSASRYATKEREDFKRLVSDLESGAFEADVLAIWESSRGSRRVSEWARLIELCEERGVRIWVTTHGRLYDPANARDRRSMHEDATDAEFESDKNSARIRRNVRAAAEAGKPHGKNIYGYLREYDPVTRELVRVVPHPEQAPVVKEAARRVLAGESMYSVARLLNERGVEPRRPKRKEHRKQAGWDGAAVKQMLTSPAYAGKRQHRGEVVGDAVWPALIPYEEWLRLQQVISPPDRRRPEAFREFTHLLGGLVFCDVCGSPLRVGRQNAGGKRLVPVLDEHGEPVVGSDGRPLKEVAMKQRLDRQQRPMVDESGEPVMVVDRPYYSTYICAGQARTPGARGFHVAMKEEHLDRIVTELVLARLERPDFLASISTRGSGNEQERKDLLAEIDGHREWLEQVRERAEKERNLDLLFDQQSRVEPKIAAAQKQLEQLSEVDPWVLAVLRDGAIREAWDDEERMGLPEKRRLIAAVMAPRLRRGNRGEKGLHPERVLPGWK